MYIYVKGLNSLFESLFRFGSQTNNKKAQKEAFMCVSVCDLSSAQYVVEAVFWVRFELCPLMPPHTHSQRVSLSVTRRGFGVGPLPDRLLYVNFMHVTPMQGKMERRTKRKSGANASTSSHCATHSISFSHFHLPSFIPSLRASISLGAELQFIFLRWLSSERWFLIPDCWVTAAPHLIIHGMPKLETKWNCFFISVSFVPHTSVRGKPLHVLSHKPVSKCKMWKSWILIMSITSIRYIYRSCLVTLKQTHTHRKLYAAQMTETDQYFEWFAISIQSSIGKQSLILAAHHMASDALGIFYIKHEYIAYTR